VTFIHIFQMSP